MRVVSIIGTRPEALKMGPVIQALRSTRGIDSIVCVTGQHAEHLKESLALFGVAADVDLASRQRGPHPDQLVATLLPQLGTLVSKKNPDWLVAAGDTTSAMCASLIAFYRRVRFAHVEAGLRTGRLAEPFPEEFHRRLSAITADLHFAPNRTARANLVREAVAFRTIIVTGNPIIDALRQMSGRSDSPRLASMLRRLQLVRRGSLRARRLLLVTFHRRENIGRPVENICTALRSLASAFRRDLSILCLVHPNPRVSRPARRLLGGTPNITLSPPVDYATMLSLMQRSSLILTDSGGLQEEAPYLGIPLLVLRNVTERPEGVTAGVVRLVGTDSRTIVAVASRLLKSPATRGGMVDRNFRAYGDGHAARRIVAAIVRRSGPTALVLPS